MTGAGTNYTANIPGFAQGTEVKYYCFTSGSGLGGTINHALADFYTINASTNGGLNYGYTVQAAAGIATIANGNWSEPLTWEGGVPPNGAAAVAVIKHNVTVNGDFTVKEVTIDAGKSLTIGNANVLTIANGGTVTNTGTLNTSGKLKFAGTGSIANPTLLYDAELNGLVDLKGSGIKNMLEIKPGGGVAAAPMPSYGAGGTLYINTGGAYSNGFEWTTEKSVGIVRIGSGSVYTLCDASHSATFSTFQHVQVDAGGTFLLDPLCGGNAPAPAGPFTAVNMLNIGGNLSIANTGKFEIQNGDIGSNQAGTRFALVVTGNLENNGSFKLNDDIGDDFYLKGNWTGNGTFNPGGNSSAGTNPVTQQDGRAVILNGTTQQSISAPNINFHYLILDNPAGAVAATNLLVSRGLGLTNGKLNLNGFAFTLGTYFSNGGTSYTLGRLYNSGPAAYTYGGSFLRLISKKDQPTDDDEQVAPNLGQPYVYPVGTADHYRPYSITYTTYPAVETSVTVRHVGGAGVVTGSQPNITDGDGVLISHMYTDAYWEVSPRTSVNGTFNVSYTCNNCNIGISNTDKIRAIRRENAAGAWSAPGSLVATTGTNASPTIGRSGLTGFSQFGIGYDPVVLPVRLKTFTGVRTPTGNLLSWNSTSEENFSHYDLQRSADGQSWSEITRIQGRGGHFEQAYRHTDQKATGTNYYRLNMVDKDGTARQSHVVVVKATDAVEAMLDAQYVPGNQSIRIHYTGVPGAQALLTDINGRVVVRKALNGDAVQYMPTGSLGSGMYILQVAEAATGKGKIHSVKIMVR
jgi:hypothetical protein